MHWMIGILLLSVTTVVVGEPRGGELYAAHCAGCHGDTGKGGVGVPLSLPSFLESVDDNFLRKTIRMGRPGRVMPAFRVLSDAQVDAIVRHVRSWSGKPAPDFSDQPVRGDAQHGKQLFASYCAACHGANGEGGRGTGVTFSRKRDLPIIAPALNNAGFLAAASDEMIRHTLQFGREDTPMRSFLVQGLSEQDIDDLVSYVRSLEKQQPTPGKPVVTVAETTIWAESSYTLEETIENLKDAIVSQNFILIRQDTLEHGLVKEGEEDPSQVILHFCNFKFLFEALAVDPRVGMFLPCRITITEKDGKVMVSAINPLYLSRLFNNSELDEYCKKMHTLYRAILDDATL
ncbi:MAG: c-type cytochrome [Gammaproteobacteria bacterium]|nr:c-type cytochrome [Gammaproteobacteria bacterium]